MADWSKLPDDLLRAIARQLHLIEDFVRFGAVCRSWHEATLCHDCTSSLKLPWLMLAPKENDDVCEFYCPSTGKVYKVLLPEIHGRRCWGSSCGWLVTVGTDRVILLINPLSRAQIIIPQLHNCANPKTLVRTPEEFRDVFIDKANLYSSPLSSDCIVMAIYSQSGKMAFTRPQDEAWTPLQSSCGPYDDIIFLDGRFLAVNSQGNVVVHDSTGSHTGTVIFTPSLLLDELLYEAKYLAELKGEIYMVIRRLFETGIYYPLDLKTWGFEVHKLDMPSMKCKEVMRLNQESLFLGNNYSFFICAADYPDSKKNCIYFTDDCMVPSDTRSSFDMGTYCLNTHKIEPYPMRHNTLSKICPPLWIRPSFW